MVTHRSSPRLRNDPYKFVRLVKGRKWQARPYCDIERERYNLGLFPTREQAAEAVRLFWRTSKGDKPKFVRPVKYRDGTTGYRALVPVALGEFATPEQAADAVRRFWRRMDGLFAEVALRRG